ncbi:unnamed protein product [Phytophthora fragariaefolia]|uniref:Unnamed protein product n=1 Tax=Phytophthora fragariaefolia TaxID=1490495 RepID=A0A9W7CM51_9STRA|nr:unnamed protein product [Phytophthora fragariaefolia]
MVNSTPHAVAVLLFKNMHLPIDDDSEFAEEAASKPASESSMMQQMLTMMQQTQNLLVQQQQQHMARPPRSPRQSMAVAAAYDQPELPEQLNESPRAAARSAMPETPFRGIRQGPDINGYTPNRFGRLPKGRGLVNAVPVACEFDDYDVHLDDYYYYDDEAKYYAYAGREENAIPNETAAYGPTDHDYYAVNPEVEACVLQAASVTTARDEESAPEPNHDYYAVNPEVEACVQQASPVTIARDEVSALKADHDDHNYDHEGQETEAYAQQTDSESAARDEESALAPDLALKREKSERGEPSLMADEKEEYDKELDERLFPLDEVEMAKRVKRNAERQRKLSLPGLSVPLNIPQERLARTRDSSPGQLASPEYSLNWYKETLAASEVAKRANRDFRAIKEDVNASPEVASVLDPKGRERFTYDDGVASAPWSVGPKRPVTTDETIVRENIVVSLCSGESTTIVSVGNPAPAKTGRLLPSRWRALVRRAVYQLVKTEDLPGTNPCPSCSSPLYSRQNGCQEPRADDSTKNGDLLVRARSVLKRSVTTDDEQLIEKLVSEVVTAFTTNATLIRSKVMERGSRCRRCRSLSSLPTRGATVKGVSFDCSSLFSPRSEAFGSNGSRHDQEDGVFEYVYVVTRAEPPGGRRPGLREVLGLSEPDDVTVDSFVDGKRIIGSIGGVEAVSVGFIDCVPTDMLIDTGAVASLVDARALVVTDVLGELAEATTVLVEGLVDLDASVRVARSLCTAHNKKVVVEVCNPSTEEMVIMKDTLVATVSDVPASAFQTSSIPSCAEQSELFSPEGNASTKCEFDWIHAVTTAFSHTANAAPSAMPELDKVLPNELNIDFSEFKLGD